MSSRSTFYLVIDNNGRVISHCRLPNEMFPPEIAEGTRLIIPADGKGPSHEIRVDLRKIRKPINNVETISDVFAPSSPEPPSLPGDAPFQIALCKALADLDGAFAARIAAIEGPLADLHKEKRRQAEAGGGPLVADDEDRQAILSNAAAQSEKVTAVERQRRTIKGRLRAATTEAELAEAMKLVNPADPKAF